MKKFFTFLLFEFIYASLFSHPPCEIVIESSFDAECVLTDFGDKPPGLILLESSCNFVCKNSRVTYTATNANGTCIWSVFGALSYTPQGNSVVVQWGDNYETGTVALEVINPDSTVCSTQLCVVLFDLPQIAVTSFPAYNNTGSVKVIEICFGETISFNDFSTQTGSSHIEGYYWSSPYGVASTRHYEITPLQSGNFRVEHKVINSCGCEIVEFYDVIVHATDLMFEISCCGTVCAGSTHTYTLAEPHCDNYIWSVENGTILGGQGSAQIIVRWNNTTLGYGTISLDLSNCGAQCPVGSIKIPIISDKVNITGPDIVCAGEKVIYELPLWGSTEYQWSATSQQDVEIETYRNANSQLVSFLRPGRYEISAEYYNDFLDCGRFVSLTKTVYVKERLIITPENSKICKGETQIFTNNMQANSVWRVYNSSNQLVHTADGYNLTYAFNAAGTFKVVADSYFACNTAVSTVTVLSPPPPLPLNSVTGTRTVCGAGASITLSAEPTSSMYSIVWEPVCMEYQRNGNTATIDYGDAVCGIRVYQRDIITGCLSDPVIYSVDVFILEPLHIAPLLNICEGETVNLSAAQQDGVLYHWTVAHTEAASVLGDDRISDVSIVVNSLSGVPTPYSIMATLKREYCGTEAYDDIILTVNSAETATVTEPQNICQNTPVAFTANGIGGILDGGSCQWSFDGGVAVAGNPGEATFATSGQHHYTLEYTQSGCSPVTVEGTIFVNPVPDAAITPSIINQKLHFGISQEIGVSYSWEKNGAVLPYETNSIINVQDRGYGVYCCTVTCNETGCAIENCMAYNYVEQSFCIPVPVSLTESGCNEYILAVESGMEYANLEWSILPNYAGNTITSISDASAVAAAFENPGNFYIYTEATVNDICYKSKTAVDIDYVLKLDINLDCPNILNVHDNSAYRAGFTIPSRTVVLKNTDADTVVSTQTLSNTENIATFTVPEVSVPVSYTAYMTLGNCTVAKEFIQYPLPTITPVYVPDVYCAKTPLKLEIAGTDISRVVWDFGDGASLNSGTYVYHTYNEGYYTLNITAYNFKGCSESYTKDIDIRENKPSGFIKTFEKTCMGIPQLIEWESTESSFFNNIYSWSTPPVNSGYQHLVYHSDYYIVTVTDDIGCVCQDMANVPFYHTPVAKIVGETSYCSGETVALSGNSGESGVTYRWVITPPDSNSYEETTPDIEIIPSAAGLYNISLTVSNVDCSSTAETEVEVFGLSPAPVLVPVGDPCVGNPPVCIMSADGRELYWSNGYYGSTACFYNEGFITARYIDENGCYSEYGKYLICPKPNFDALLTGCYDRCESKYRLGIYNLMPSTNYGNCPQSTYQWFGDGNLLQTGNFEDSVQSFSVAVPGEHYMEVYYGDDCVATSPALTINKDEKCCKYEYKILENHCFMENGNLYYIIEIEICNTGSEDLFLYNLFVNENDGYSIRYWTVSQQDLRPGQCTRLKIILDASFVSSPAFFTFINFRNNCYVDFSVQPDLEDCMCKNEVTIFNTNCLMENGKLFFEIEVRICNTGTIPLDYYLLNVNNGYTIHNNLTPLYLEPGECKIFYIMAEVNDLSLYAAMFTLYAKNTKCVAAFSVPLLPDSKECACNTDADVEVNGFYCYAKDCKLYVNTYLKICNTGTTSLNMHNLNVIGGYVTNWSVSNSYLQPGECVYLSADIEINDFSMSSLSFVLSDGKQECLVFSLPLDLKECTGIKDDCKFENINFSFKQDLSTWQTLYFDFELVLPAGTTDLPGIWVEPSITVDYNYNPTQYVKGTFVFYYGSLKELVAEGKSICIYALVCIENKYLCLAKICIPAKDFYDQTQKPEPHIMLPEKENNISTGSISVSPNPAKDELFILNSGQFTVTGVEILDSAGKTITGIQSKNINSVDVSALPQGVYLIKIYTEKGTTVEKFNKK